MTQLNIWVIDKHKMIKFCILIKYIGHGDDGLVCEELLCELVEYKMLQGENPDLLG